MLSRDELDGLAGHVAPDAIVDDSRRQAAPVKRIRLVE
jgi:hypothetical protein